MQKSPYKLKVTVNLEFSIESCNYLDVLFAFMSGLKGLFSQVLKEVLCHYAVLYKEQGLLNELLDHKAKITWKSLKGKSQTCIHTVFGKVWLPQIIVRLHSDGGTSSRCITRQLLGISPHQRIPDQVKAMMALLSSLCSYRTARYCVNSMFGCWNYGLSSFHRAVGWLSSKMILSPHVGAGTTYLADATGVATLHTGKRGSELKILAQLTESGKVVLSNIAIGRYGDKEEWAALFAPLKEVFNTVELCKKLQLIIDGCKGILAGAKSLSERIKIQRDVWHTTHQLKYYTWKDKATAQHKAELILKVAKAVFPKPGISHSKAIEYLTDAILFCDTFDYKHTRTYLLNAAQYLYTHHQTEMPTVCSSKVERMMRTVNQRMDIGVWSEQGALAVAKIRLAYFYNGLRWENFESFNENIMLKIKHSLFHTNNSRMDNTNIFRIRQTNYDLEYNPLPA